MKKLSNVVGVFLVMILLFSGCSKDDEALVYDFVAAFKEPSADFSQPDQTRLEIEIIFSEKARANGFIEISLAVENLVYNQNFTTSLPLENGVITVPIRQGENQTQFTLKKLESSEEGESQEVAFNIVQIEYENLPTSIQGNTSTLISFSGSASLGGTLKPNIGGPNEPHQVFVELRTKNMTESRRDLWDLAFYSGNRFRVKLNASMYMFAGSLDKTDIDSVTPDDALSIQNHLNFLMPGSHQYIDNPNGDLESLAIASISENDEENKVYLLNMGNEIGTNQPETGSVAVAGAARGYKKVRILIREGAYLLQYADLNETEHHEILIPKTSGFSFSFFSIISQSIVNIEPPADNWDLKFTVSEEIEELPGTNGELTAYGYSDFVETNTLGKVSAYRISTQEFSYTDFKFSDINPDRLSFDQNTIGSSWRQVPPPILHNDVFYVLKDAKENYYKLRFTAFQDENGERGHPEFEYKRLF